MAAVTTELKVAVKVAGERGLDQLKKSLVNIGKQSNLTDKSFSQLSKKLKEVQSRTTQSVSNLRAYSNAWKDIAESVEIGSKEFKEARAEAARLDRQLEKTTSRRRDRPSAAAGLRGGVAALAGIVGTAEIVQQGRQVIGASLERGASEQRLRALSAGFDSFASTVDVASRAAERFNLSQTDAQQQLAQVYGRLRPLGLTLQEIESTFVGFNTAARLSGATASESAGAFLQLSQALGSGVLRGEEFNSISEQAPLVLSAIAEVMDEPVGALKDLAKEGRITSDIVLKALQDIETKGAARLADVLDTPAAKLEKLNARLEDLRVALGDLSLPAFINIVEELTTIIEQSTKRVELYALGFEQLKLDIQSLTRLMPPWGNATVKVLRYIGTEANIVFRLFQGIDLLLQNAAKRRQATLGPAPTEYDITQGADLDMNAIRLASQRATRLKALQDLSVDSEKPTAAKRGPSAEDILKKQLAAGKDIAKQLQREIDLRNASNNLERELLKIKFNYEDVVANINANAAERQQQELLNLAERNRLDQENLVTIEARDKKLQEAFKMDFAGLFKQDQGKLQKFISDSQDSLKDLEQVAINVSQGVGSAIADSLVNGIQGLIEGSTKVKDVFANLLKSVGQILAQEGAKMIATYIAIGIAKAFAGLSGGTKFGEMGNFDQAVPGASGFSTPSSFNASGLFGRANGGPISGGRPYLVGEQGPELFMPRAGGAVTSNRELRQAMSQPASSMNFTFETTNIGGQEFVSREQLEAAMATTRRQAANDGAKRGMNMTLDRMQNSPRTRARVGIS